MYIVLILIDECIAIPFTCILIKEEVLIQLKTNESNWYTCTYLFDTPDFNKSQVLNDFLNYLLSLEKFQQYIKWINLSTRNYILKR